MSEEAAYPWKRIVALHGLLGEAIGVIIGVSMRDDVGEDLRHDLAAIADELRGKAAALAEQGKGESVMREPGNYQLFQEEIEQHVKLVSVRHGREYECEHMTPPISKYETGHIRRTSGGVCEITMCCECYQKLRGLGLAPLKGTWED